MKPSQEIRRAARIREAKRGVSQPKPRPTVEDVFRVLDRIEKRLALTEAKLTQLEAVLIRKS